MLSKLKVLSSNPSTTKERKKLRFKKVDDLNGNYVRPGIGGACL
jgi:hypothetical protein